jgi:HAD superfamily hydrolase (TIGR01459 family)
VKTATRLDGIGELLDGFDAFVLDQWGVLHEGNALYPGVPEAMALLRSAGKRVLILTNSSKTAIRNVTRLDSRFGLGPGTYDELISSAQLLRDHLALGAPSGLVPLPPGKDTLRAVTVVADEGDEVLLDGLPLGVVEDVADADAVVLLSVPEDFRVESARGWVERAVARGLSMLCPSADVHSVRPGGVISGMAALTVEYQRRGGTVVNFGKPDRHVYDHCSALLGGIPARRVLAVGDQLGSDVLGAQSVGWAAALVETGAGALSARHEGTAGIVPDFVLPVLRP